MSYPVRYVCIWFLLMSVFACRDENPKPKTDLANLQIQLNNYFNNQPFVLGQKYTLPNQDTVALTQFRLYLSHFSLKDKSGKNLYTAKSSYHLMEQTSFNSKKQITFTDLPNCRPDSLVFYIGIDSVKNYSTELEGDLDYNNGMYWDWKTGYKFLLLEGNYTAQSKQLPLVFHAGESSNYRRYSIALENTEIKTNQQNLIKLMVKMENIFLKPNFISPKKEGKSPTGLTIMTGKPAEKLGENYARDFIIKDTN